ncbi:cornifelin homolog [Megalops cyprinoides]|uniref:cornifelin homolog n=1 Tax=Megalops cyprinoides TaxID=118141 RepID=UPI001864D270|nr:cornifelin homolog [Megalops cyprinoides]
MSIQPIVTVQPGVVYASVHVKSEAWGSDMCDCCEDMGICCLGFWCPWCLMCKTSREFGECLCLPLLDTFCGGMVRPVSLSIRSTMRERYHIQGTMCDDCCVVTCCTCCAWCQMAREIKRRRRPLVLAPSAPLPPGLHPPHPLQPMPAGLYPQVPQ